MARIKPFRGILYDPKKVDIAKVTAPPYDVISPQIQDCLYKEDAHNIVRIILGKSEKTDVRESDKYARAGALLKNWLKGGIFAEDKNPSIYIYSQAYLHKGKKRRRIGFVALMKIEDPRKSGILPHEYTLDKPKKDRFKLISKVGANLSPIFSLFHDKKNLIARILKFYASSRTPIVILNSEGVEHKLWRMEDNGAIRRIAKEMKEKKIFIADGHHRYEVALAYRNKMHGSRKFKKNMDYVMMYFANLSEKGGGLTVLSTHRVITNLGNINEKKLLGDLGNHFRITKADSLKGALKRVEGGPRKRHVIGMYVGQGRFWVFTMKPGVPKKLDVSILHELIINKILNVKNPESSIKYVRDEKVCVSLVDSGNYQAAFFLRPTAVSDMKTIAEKGEMMPQKSTYFYPKLLSGLVINRF